MNGRQRILLTIAGEQVDRPALAPFLHVNFVKEHRRDNAIDPVVETIAVYDEFGFDLIHRNCTPVYDDFTIQGPDWEPRISETGDAAKTLTTVTVSTPGGQLRRVTQCGRLYKYESSCFLLEPPIKSPADLDLFMRYQPPAPAIDAAEITRARELAGDKGIVAPWVQGAFNEVAYLLRGHAILVDPLDDEGFYRGMISYFLARNLEKIRQFVAAGAEFISVGGNEANGAAVGPDYFRRYVLEYETRLMESLHGFGGRAIYHNCGRAALLLPILREIGMDVYESLAPPPFGDTKLAEATRIMNDVALMGGLDQIDFLRKATPAMIQRRVREMAEIAAEHGRFILGTSDYINESTPVENLHALREAIEPR
jgi:uroporphyrinogen decarboxylase